MNGHGWFVGNHCHEMRTPDGCAGGNGGEECPSRALDARRPLHPFEVLRDSAVPPMQQIAVASTTSHGLCSVVRHMMTSYMEYPGRQLHRLRAALDRVDIAGHS